MSFNKELGRKADEYFDTNEFEKAIEIYKGILLESPEAPVLMSLDLAWRFSQIQFLKHLIELNPQNFLAHRLIYKLKETDSPQATIRFLSDSIKKFDHNLSLVLSLRSQRLKMAITTKNPELALDDFYFLWNTEPSPRAKHFFIETLCTATSIEFLSMFSMLASDNNFSENLRHFFKQKHDELITLSELYPHL
jgi:hypothetical protein